MRFLVILFISALVSFSHAFDKIPVISLNKKNKLTTNSISSKLFSKTQKYFLDKSFDQLQKSFELIRPSQFKEWELRQIRIGFKLKGQVGSSDYDDTSLGLDTSQVMIFQKVNK